MRLEPAKPGPALAERGIAPRELREQMGSLEGKLGPRDRQLRPAHATAPDLRAVEPVSAAFRLARDAGKVGTDRRQGIATSAETQKLGVMPIASRFPRKHLLREKPFAPKRDQALPVEIAGMKRPETHGREVNTRSAKALAPFPAEIRTRDRGKLG